MCAARNAQQSEVFELKARYEEQLANQTQQVELLVADVDKHAQAAMAAQKERDAAVARAVSGMQGNSAESRVSEGMAQLSTTIQGLEADVALKDKEIARLIGDCQRLQASRDTEVGRVMRQLSDLEHTLGEAEGEIMDLRQRVEACSDYDEVWCKPEQRCVRSRPVAHLVDGRSRSSFPS